MFCEICDKRIHDEPYVCDVCGVDICRQCMTYDDNGIVICVHCDKIEKENEYQDVLMRDIGIKQMAQSEDEANIYV